VDIIESRRLLNGGIRAAGMQIPAASQLQEVSVWGRRLAEPEIARLNEFRKCGLKLEVD